MEKTLRNLLRTNVSYLQFSEIIDQPVDIMIGVGNEERITLSLMGIKTIRDLACSPAFEQAFEKCYEISGLDADTNLPLLEPDIINSLYPDATLGLEQIPQLDEKMRNRLEKHLGIKNIVDLAQWGPYNISRYIRNIVLGTVPDN